VALVQIFAP